MSDDHQQRVQQQFGAHATGYVTSADHAQGYSLSRLIELLDPQPDWSVLDVATGGGHTALRIAPHVESMVATDLTRPMLNAAREHLAQERGIQVTFCQADAEHLPYPDNHFDCVTCRIAAHHFQNAIAFVEEAARVLKPGGWLGVTDNMVSGEVKIAQYVNMFEKLRDPSHNWAYTHDDWNTFCFSAGFTVTHTETFHKAIDFDTWGTRMGMVGDDLARLRVLLVQASKDVKAWLQPQQIGSRLCFKLTECIVIGRKAPPS